MSKTPLPCVLVMPAYNEAACIAQQIAAWNTVLRSHFNDDYAILVMDDGSRDETPQILDALQSPNVLVRHQPNQGHGAAIRTLYNEAITMNCEYIFQTDSDNQFNTEDFALLWQQRARSRFILGYRHNRDDPMHRLIISWATTRILRIAFAISAPDSNTPFRLMRADFLKQLLAIIPANVFAPNIFLTIAALRLREPVLSIPVAHQPRTTGKPSIVSWNLARATLRSLAELLRYRFQ